MSERELKQVRASMKPFIQLMLAVMCLTMIAGCGGGGATQEDQVPVVINSINDLPTASQASFDIKKLDQNSQGLPLSEVNGYIVNHFWVSSDSISNEALLSVLGKYDKIKPIAAEPGMGILIEVKDEGSIDTVNQIAALRKENGVDHVFNQSYIGSGLRENRIYNIGLPNDGVDFNGANSNWYLKYVAVDTAWNYTTGSEDVHVGVMDAGLYQNHEDLIGRIKNNMAPMEEHTHGTAVVGAIAANADNGLGVSGINWKSPVIFGAFVDGDVALSAINYRNLIKSDEKIRVINSSWGDAFCKKDICPDISDAIRLTRHYRKIAADYKNILHVWAAGNDSRGARFQNGALHLDDNGLLKPLENIIVVAAVLKDGTLAAYSDHGDTIDIAAPTEYRAAKSTANGNKYYTSRDDTYGVNCSGTQPTCDGPGAFGGTSAAAPIVTGVASLMYSINPTLTPAQVKTILIRTADRTATRKTPIGSVGATSVDGHNIPILNAERAVQAARDWGKPTKIVPEEVIAGATQKFSLIGMGLPIDQNFDITFVGCFNIEYLSRSENMHEFSCQMNNSAGSYKAVIRKQGSTDVLASFDVVASKPATPHVLDTTFTPGTTSKLEVTFDVDMGPNILTTGSYTLKAGGEGSWVTPRKFVIEFASVVPGGAITLQGKGQISINGVQTNVNGFTSVDGVPLATDVVFTFPSASTEEVLFRDSFDGVNQLDSTKWNATEQIGSSACVAQVVEDGKLNFYGTGRVLADIASDKKYTKVVIEARFSKNTTGLTGDYERASLNLEMIGIRFNIVEFSRGESHIWNYQNKADDVISSVPDGFNEYRITIDGTSVKIERGMTLSAITVSKTYDAPYNFDFYGTRLHLELESDGPCGVKNGSFDWVRVKAIQ
jgi:subtilisin family serine protease